MPLGAAFTALAIENVFYTLSVGAVIAAGTVALLLRGGLASDVRMAGEIAIGAVLAAYVVVAWALLRRPALLSRGVAVLGRVWPSTRGFAGLDKVRRLEQDIYTFTSRRRQALGPVVLPRIRSCRRLAGSFPGWRDQPTTRRSPLATDRLQY